MSEPYPVVDVNDWSLEDSESVGGDEKEWIRAPDGGLWLFKPRTERHGRVQGEDWAEKISTEVAGVLGMPAAQVDLAERAGRRGTVSLSLRREGWELQHGSVLLAGLVPGHEPRSRDRRGHTLANIERVLAGYGPPPAFDAPVGMTAFEVFAGYLVLDALVANQDRHEENWAVLRPLPGDEPAALAGSYDHGSSLGFNLTDDRRILELRRGSLPVWARRGTAQRFERASDGQLSLVGLASRALSRCAPAGREYWMQAMAHCDAASWRRIVERVPNLSDPARMFVLALLETNQGRLLDES